jgi:Cysteine-rich CPXCG
VPGDRVEIQCPYCGELLELQVEEDLKGKLVQDCEVCCNPIQLDIRRDEWGDPQVAVDRAD